MKLFRHPISEKKNGNAENQVTGSKQTHVSNIIILLQLFEAIFSTFAINSTLKTVK